MCVVSEKEKPDMAYAALVSLKQTIQRLLNSSHISIVSSTREIIEFAYNEATSLQQQVLESNSKIRRSSKKLDALDVQIREAVQLIENLLEYLFRSQSESYGDEDSSHLHSLDLGEVMIRDKINSFAETVKKMGQAYVAEVENLLPEKDDDGAATSSDIDFGVKMVGFSDEFGRIKVEMRQPVRPDESGVLTMLGRAGTGRTVVARRIFEECIGKKQYFDCCAWVTIGPKYQVKDILICILAQIDDELHINSEVDETLVAEYSCTCLSGRRYMIVLDDVCDTQILDKLKSSFSLQNNGSILMLTTSLSEVAEYVGGFFTRQFFIYPEGVVCDLIRMLAFGPASAPADYEEAVRKIARSCGGRIISVAKVHLFLWKAEEKTPEYWSKIAADKENPIFTVADEISEISKIQEDLRNLFPNEETNVPFFIKQMIDFSSRFESIMMDLFPKMFLPRTKVISFVGTAGIGKTTFVKKIFEDPKVLQHFDHHAWITLGPKYQSNDILVDILAQIYPYIKKIQMKGDAELAKDLCAHLSKKSCLIVLDDVWSKEPLHCLKKLFPDIKGIALVTTRIAAVARFEESDHIHEMRYLNKEESWDLLCQKVFAEEPCPPKLEKAGKKIAENCEGLPLTIVTVAKLLSKAEKTPEYWNEVAADTQNSLFMDAYNEMSKALLPSYESLPQHLKACILYMGVFRQNYEIPTSKLIKCWSAEGFLEPNPSQTVEDFAAECLLELVDQNLVMVCQKGSNFRVKTCRHHSGFWYLSNKEAAKNKFFHAFDTYVNISEEDIKNQRRLCVRNGILFGIKDMQNSMGSVSTARSLLCTGPHHQYPVPICLNLRLLRVLDALTILFYEFPIEVVKLIHLRYLALTCNGKLPDSISKLWNLHFLIVRRNLSIRSYGDSSYLPMEIWDMKELKHLQIMGSNLPSPISGAVLPNLLTLLGVNADSCTEEVLRGIPNLKRLGIQIELAPDDDGKSFNCMNHISHLSVLESLKCVVVYPTLNPEVVVLPTSVSMFPSSLKKLSLSGLGYPWEYMNILGEFKNLEVLKLRCYAFRGRELEIGDFGFQKLKYLLIEDTDLVCWKCTMFSFVTLKHLSIRHCYKLEELPSNMAAGVEKIEVVDCSPFAQSWAKQKEAKFFRESHRADTNFKAIVHSSWDTGKPQVMTGSWTDMFF